MNHCDNSRPATVAAASPGCLLPAIGWRALVRNRAHLTIDSYADPAISALTDPLLASHPDRLRRARRAALCRPVGRQMRSHYLTIAGFQLVLAASVSLRVLAVRIPPRLPPLRQAFTHVMRTRTAASAAWSHAPGSGCIISARQRRCGRRAVGVHVAGDAHGHSARPCSPLRECRLMPIFCARPVAARWYRPQPPWHSGSDRISALRAECTSGYFVAREHHQGGRKRVSKTSFPRTIRCSRIRGQS
jgi:hypothetical protein